MRMNTGNNNHQLVAAIYMLRVGLGWILIKKWCSDGHTTNTVFIWTL